MTENFNKLIPIIILNWNGTNDTIDCLKSIKKSSSEGWLSVLVDNGSERDTLEPLKEKCHSIYEKIIFLKQIEVCNFQPDILFKNINKTTQNTLIFIENDTNLGFAKGNNVGIKFADAIEAKWVMLLNNDTIVLKNTFDELTKFIHSNLSVKAITPQIRLFEPDTKIWNCGGGLTYLGSRKYLYENVDISDVPQSGFANITFITGCALLFNFKETGILSELFYFGEEDYEFSLRMNKQKIEMACVFSSIIHHKVGASIKKSSKPLGSIIVHYVNRLINTRNYYSFIRWHLTMLACFLYLPILLYRINLNPLKAIKLIRIINSYVKNNNDVNNHKFHEIINNDY